MILSSSFLVLIKFYIKHNEFYLLIFVLYACFVFICYRLSIRWCDICLLFPVLSVYCFLCYPFTVSRVIRLLFPIWYTLQFTILYLTVYCFVFISLLDLRIWFVRYPFAVVCYRRFTQIPVRNFGYYFSRLIMT